MSVDVSKGATVELVKTLSDDLRTKNDGTKYTSAGAGVRALESETNDLKSAFIYENEALELSAVTDGYIDANGNVAGTGGGARHVSAIIDSSLVGQEINVSGVAWWGMKPFVFVGSDSSVVSADVPSPSGTVTPYSDLPFIPAITGTLYINYHTDRPVFDATVTVLKSIKEDKLPSDLAEELETIQSYAKVGLTTITGKYLNGSNGNITDVDSTSAVITDYIDVIANRPYLITTEHFWGQGMYVWYDSGKNYISGVSSANSGTITKIRNEKVVAPSNAKYLVIAMWTQGNFPPITLYEGQYHHIVENLKWSGKKWVCLGDSLTGENLTCVYHYYDAVAANTGISVHQMGVGGSGYANDNGNNYAFWRRALTVPSDADVITIFGSFNDLSTGLPLGTVTDNDTSSIAGCMNKTIENILSVIPIANIGIVAPTPWSTTRPSTTGSAYDYVEMLKAVADRWSLPFLDLWRGSGLMPWDENFTAIAYPSGDTVHPNDIGQQIIAPKFKSFLETLLM